MSPPVLPRLTQALRQEFARALACGMSRIVLALLNLALSSLLAGSVVVFLALLVLAQAIPLSEWNPANPLRILFAVHALILSAGSCLWAFWEHLRGGKYRWWVQALPFALLLSTTLGLALAP